VEFGLCTLVLGFVLGLWIGILRIVGLVVWFCIGFNACFVMLRFAGFCGIVYMKFAWIVLVVELCFLLFGFCNGLDCV